MDVYGQKRRAGQEWIVKSQDSQMHIKDVYEEIVGLENAVSLTSRQYCVVLNPVGKETQENQWGSKILITGEKTFFL